MRAPCFLCRRAQFVAVLRLGRRVSGKFLTLIFTPTNESSARLGVSITRRHVRLAVKRNRWRRMLKEHFRQQLAPRTPRFDLLLTSQPELKNAVAAAVMEEFTGLLKKIKRR